MSQSEQLKDLARRLRVWAEPVPEHAFWWVIKDLESVAGGGPTSINMSVDQWISYANELLAKVEDKPAQAVVNDVTAALRRMADKTAQFVREAHSWLAQQPQTLSCPHGEPHDLDIDQSTRKSWSDKKMVTVYSPCQKCVAQKVSDEESRRLGAMGVPARLLHAKIDNWRPRTNQDRVIKAKVERFISMRRGMLLLSGGVGLGKGHLAVAILRTRRSGRFISQNGFLLKLRETYRDDKAENIIEACKKVGVLVLDELGISGGGRDEFPALYDVVNHRYENDLQTVITTNSQPDKLQEMLGERIFDRLADAVTCELKGESWRGR